MKLTRNDVLKKQKRIEELREQLRKLRQDRSEQGRPERVDLGFAYYPDIDSYNESAEVLKAAIRKEEEDIRTAEIVDELAIPENIIGLEDNVTLLMQYGTEAPFEETFVISNMPELGQSFVTPSSPIGRAIYGKEVGATVKCKTPAGDLTIVILSKNKGLKL